MRACIVVALLLLGACGGSDGGGDGAPDDTPPCVDLYAEGASTDDIDQQMGGQPGTGGCIDAEGEWVLHAMLSFDCEDGERTVRYNDNGWGISGETWNHYDNPSDNAPAADVC